MKVGQWAARAITRACMRSVRIRGERVRRSARPFSESMSAWGRSKGPISHSGAMAASFITSFPSLVDAKPRWQISAPHGHRRKQRSLQVWDRRAVVEELSRHWALKQY